MIRFQQVTLARGVKPLLENVDVTLNPGDKIGLIGANGAGKSSLFAMLRGELHADQGNIDYPTKWRVAYVAQETPALDRAAVEYAIDGDVTLRRLEAQLAAAEAEPESAENGIRIGELYGALADADVYTVRSRAEQLLLGLGFTLEQMERPVASFSGGWRMRLNLAQALMCPSDLLLLDEPTNHLDLDAIIWLEDWLKRYAGTLIIISHDRDFLDGVVNVIVHIDERKLKRYSGNYSAFERQRAAQLELAAGMIEKQMRQRAHLHSFIDRFKAKASKARQAQSRMKALAKMEELAPLRAAAEFSFEFREPLSAPNPLLVMEKVNAGYRSEDPETYEISEKVIVGGIDFSLQTGQRIGLLGVNGAGKSTLIKTIANELDPIAGTAQFGKGLVIGYFAQHQVEMLRHDESPLWHLARIAPDVREQELRNFLGSFNFNGVMASSSIAPFSGGEKARLALALIVWQRPNLLLLDEPTNHLDLETREALTMALAQFEGTLVLVSHDRHLLRATTDQFLIVADGKLQPFDGDLDDYRDWLFKTKLAAKNSATEAAQAAAAKPKAEPKIVQKAPEPVAAEAAVGDRREQKRLDAGERQRLAGLKKPIESRIKRLEEQIAKCNEKKAVIDARLAAPDIYDAANKEELKKLIADQAYCTKELEQLEEDWLGQQEALEQLVA
ncbi:MULTISPECIES: ATP-binding cassette domain-containing protein [unclassified Herbaspirillum]|uniref:ATP-binding cassette domain-containing protein n=1 Tax=unclassified Herbaspirillum TaxID=2624150 RepID=UPI000E2F7395|nr:MULTISPECIES: ATP-binding cassette domain-containing protein [unclassified Herbaspirillum]RFB72814.1 ATP-binding cassette domain-containing protein [Herbaspirillum sp. 3R-3a1]TFI11379.1 ATP-binding cassette domain-containing protein [Herbaspirillum sp. 3R11]TFI17287.1 ATP-binding cassette domain-containing protein [Herbaspirillum sp. 3R-11]TFI20943.1 ATP-binding cassette domain-containing protein [Herbaspirillum sp. 3C11]